jgi:hypothetical protein
MTPSAFLALLPSAALAFVAAWFWFDRNAKARALEVARLATIERDARISQLEQDHAVLEAAVTPFEEAYKQMLIKQLTHFHTPVLDDLLAREADLTEEELEQMAELLKERAHAVDGRISPSERDAALILTAVIRRARAEAAAIADPNIPKPVMKVVAVVELPG